MTKIKTLPFLQVVTDITSKYNKIKNEDYLSNGLFPIVDQGQTFIGGYSNNLSLVNKENIPVIVFGDHTKALKYIDFPFIIGADGVKVLKIDEKIAHPKYIYYLLKTIKLPESGYSRNFKYLKDIKLPITERLLDQFYIVSILSRTENLIIQRNESIRLLDEYLKSTFLEMFGTISIPKYTTDTINNYSLKITDGTHLGPKFIDFGVPFLLVSNIKNNEIDYNTKKYITEEEYQELNKRTPIEKGDILITSVGSYGNPALVKTITKFAFQRHIAYIKPDMNKINNVYLFGALKSDFVKIQIDNAVRGVAQKTLNLSELKKILIPIPPIELQNKFANIVEKTEILKIQYQSSLQELENLYNSLSQQAFKGELNAKDEELLMAAESRVEYNTK